LLKLVKSICYYYSPKKPITETVQIIQIIITETKRFVVGSTLYTIFVNLKKEEEKDRAFISIFESFIRKLNKGKGYQLIEDLAQIDNSDQTFKVFEENAFDEEVYTLSNTSDILKSLSERESLELEWVS